MYLVLCIMLCALGHAVRDGMWPVHSTHLCRFIGAFWCLGGALAVLPYPAAYACAAAIWVGFYFDQKHAEGQRAQSWADVGYLTLSGVTSLMPLAAAAYWFDGAWWVLLFGLSKPLIWFLAAQSAWARDHRAAATTFGAVVGVVLVLLAV